MTRPTVDEVLAFLRASKVRQLDITGGAPSSIRNFRYLVSAAREFGVHVMDRCNLTILSQPGQEDLPAVPRAQQVAVVASLPCYLEENVDRQRGKGVFDASISALQSLNRLGYGQPGTALQLSLVYNPQGPVLPPAQAQLEADYRAHLGSRYGIVFNELYVITNMPIQRFGSMLISKGQFEHYMHLLKNAFKPANLDAVMCRNLVSVDWRGYAYDCDFNQMLGLPLAHQGRARTHVRDLLGVDIERNPIMVADHCYGCTAGQGSSCGGALVD